jgi:hypothetical protein
MTRTPAIPTAMPAAFAPVNRSSRVAKCATSTVKIGTVAVRIPARPVSIRVRPQALSVMGRVVLRSPKTNSDRQSAHP